MSKASSMEHQGVPTFTYSPAASRRQGLLFELNRPLDELEEMLLSEYAGRSLTVRSIYKEHSVGRPYISKNYKDVLASMEQQGTIKTEGRKRKYGFGDGITVIFPEKR